MEIVGQVWRNVLLVSGEGSDARTRRLTVAGSSSAVGYSRYVLRCKLPQIVKPRGMDLNWATEAPKKGNRPLLGCLVRHRKAGSNALCSVCWRF